MVVALLALLVPALAMGQDARTVEVHFPRGTSGTTLNDTITGYQSVNYHLGVSAGQQMSVQLDTSNSSAYFNIIAPGASEALYNGSVSGNSASIVIPSSGKYTIQVYLMRNAARRNETANYSLTLYVENASARPTQAPVVNASSNGAPTAVSTDMMPRYCAGEASAKFGVRPQDITTNMAFKSGNNYVSQGYFDNNGSSTFFNCYFGLDGSFKSVN
jgi:hypothetical protein